MRVELRCPAIFFGGAPVASALGRRAFFPLVVPGQIFARATKREKIVRPDFLFAALSTGLSTAAGKMALSFAARQTAFEQTTPSLKKGSHDSSKCLDCSRRNSNW